MGACREARVGVSPPPPINENKEEIFSMRGGGAFSPYGGLFLLMDLFLSMWRPFFPYGVFFSIGGRTLFLPKNRNGSFLFLCGLFSTYRGAFFGLASPKNVSAAAHVHLHVYYDSMSQMSPFK